MFLKEVEGTLKMTTFCLLTYSLILPGDAAAFWKTLPGLPGLVTPLLHRPSSKLAASEQAKAQSQAKQRDNKHFERNLQRKTQHHHNWLAVGC